nr:hypothetical protein [Tanacetum cinerariifolium]
MILSKLNDDDLEEMDLKWQVAMTSMRIKKFHKRTGKKMQFDTRDTVGFDKTKLECFNCHKMGHFARECRAKWNQDSRRRDGGYNGNKARDNSKRPAYQDDSKALVTIDGEAVDWSGMLKSYARLKKLYDEQKDKLEIDYSQFTYGPKQTSANESDSKPVGYASSDSDSSVEPSRYVPEPVVNELKARMAKQAALIKSKEKGTGQQAHRPIWNNAQRVNHQNKFVPLAVLNKTGKIPVNVARQNFSWQAALTTRKVNTARPFVKETRPKRCFYKSHSPNKRPLNNKTTQRNTFANHKVNTINKSLNAVKGNWDTAAKALADCSNGRITGKEKIKAGRLKGIKREYSNARTPQQNGVAERKNKTLIEAARTILADLFLPTTFWAEAVNTACYVLNRVLVTKPQNKTPYELLTGIQPIISYLRPFGCHVTILNTIDQLGKFDGKSDSGFLVGYSLNSKAFKVYNLETKRVEENLHVNFLENKPNVAGKGHAWMFDLDYLTNSMNYEPVSLENQANKSIDLKEANHSAWDKIGKNEKPVSQVEQIFQEELETLKIQEKDANDAARKEATHETQDVHTNNTNSLNVLSTPVSDVGPSRALNDDEPSYPDDPSMPHFEDIYASLSAGIFTNSSYDDEGVVTDLNNLDPLSAVQTKSKVHKNSKAHALFKIQKVWILIDLPFGKNAIGTKWVYKNKKDERGVVVRNKARLVTQGHRQEEGIDYDELFSHVARIEAIMIFLAFASYMGFIVYQMDVKSNFLYGTIDEEVYVTQPPGFVDPKFPNKVYKVVKALYGLHQAPRAWSMIGSLTYLTASRPDIMFAVCACSRFQVTPKTSHLQAVKRIFRYLKCQPKLGLWYPKVSSFNLEAYSDSDYAGANLDRKSTTVGCQFLGRRLISWQCKKHTIMDTSTTEAEYVAAAHCCGQVLWIQNQLLDYGFNLMNTKIYIDNESAICIVKNPVFHSKTKHNEIRHHFIRDANEKKLIQVLKIHIYDNVVDILTKAFDVSSKELASPKQTALGKDKSNPLIAKPTKSEGFEQTIDFLNGSLVRYALTSSPTIRTSCIKQFWSTAMVKTVNDEVRVQAIIDGKRVTIKESFIHRTLKFDDEERISCLANDDIFTGLANMGYENIALVLKPPPGMNLAALWHQQSSILPQTRSLTTSAGDMSHHQDIYDNPSLTKKVFSNMKRVGTGFSGVITPLFESMLVQDAKEVGEAQDDVSIPIKPSTSKPHKKHKSKKQQPKAPKVPSPAPSPEHHIPSPSNDPIPDADKDSLTLQELMDLRTRLSNKVLDLKSEVIDIKSSFTYRIQKLEDKVDQLDEENKEEPGKVEEVLEVVKAAKLMTKVVTTAEPTTIAAQVPKPSAPRRRRGVIIQDPEETATSVIIYSEVQSKDKGIRILIEEPKPLKGQAQIDMDEAFARQLKAELNANINWNDVIEPIFEKHYNSIQAFLEKVEEEVTVQKEGNKRQGGSLEQDIAKKQRMDEEAEELKIHLQIVANDDDDVFTEATPLASKVPVIDYQIHYENNKPYYKIIRADGTHKLFLSFITLLKNFDREDLEALWKLVKERFETTEPKNFLDDFLLNILRIMFEKPNIEASMFLLVEKKYPLIHFTLQQMLDNVRLKVKEESEMSLELLRSRNDTNDDDADIKPTYDEEPMAEVQLNAKCNIFAIGQQHTDQPEIINEGRVDHNKAKIKKEIDVLETINIELEHKVANFRKENKTLKKHYKDLYDSIKIIRTKTIKQTTSLLTNNADLKAQIQEKVFAIAALKNDLRKLKRNSVDTKFAKTSVLGKPILQLLRNQSVVRHPDAFKSERPQMSKQRFASQVDVNNNLSRPITQHCLPKKRESIFAKPDHMIATSSYRNSSKNMLRFSSNDMVQNSYLEEARRKTHERNRNSKSSMMHTVSPQTTAKDSKPKPRSINQTSRSLPSRWIPTGKLFDSCTSKVDSEPPHGSNVDISKIHECKQTLDLSAGISINVQKEQSLDLSAVQASLVNVKEVPTTDMIRITTMIELESLFDPSFDEYFNGVNQVVSKSFAVSTVDASDKRQQQPDSTSSTSTLATTVTADGNFNVWKSAPAFEY